MARIKITVAYDGTHYHGWQRQKNAITVEALVEQAVHEIFRENNKIIGASRTDTGVHARGQVVIFDTDKAIPLRRIPLALNAKLPEDIVVVKAEEVAEDFHPRYHAVHKTYAYHLDHGDYVLPEYRFNTLGVRGSLDVKAMKEASQFFIGTHDFKGFCSTGSSVKSTVRTINWLKIHEEGTRITVTVNGNGFLYNMVRIMVGTLIEVGKGKMKSEEMKAIVSSGQRERAGKTAPAKGLSLYEITYE